MKILLNTIKNILLVVIFLGFSASNTLADTLYPGEMGRGLSQHLVEDFRPERTMSYNRARDLLYGDIDNQDGILAGIYTNFQVAVDPQSSRPRQDAYQGGQGINAEHVWPQSKGAKRMAKSDLHPLFPAKVSVNGDRGNKPFGDIPDPQTRRWYRGAELLERIPSTGIDDYSESTSGHFEPREDRKGDIARAMFYFYTMYQEQADSADRSFFRKQRSTLCDWQAVDPVSPEELERSHKIAESPQGNENPFILDDSLAERAYCTEVIS